MCGIVGYLGKKDAIHQVLKGLKRLEYRGYDSAGLSFQKAGIQTFKKEGNVEILEEALRIVDFKTNSCIGHTRWATHGSPSDKNAHPHNSKQNRISVVHNGIIENYIDLKEELIRTGQSFISETDSEVIPHLLNNFLDEGLSPVEALNKLNAKLIGAYAIVVLIADFPKEMFAIKKGSLMVLGLGNNEFIIASDPSPIVEHTKKVIYLNDNEILHLDNEDFTIHDSYNSNKSAKIETLDMELEMIEKKGYDHFMIKEIFEQPTTIQNSLRGRTDVVNNKIILGGINQYAPHLYNARNILILGCGTSLYAGMIGQYFFERIARVPTQIDFASEFRYKNPIISSGDAILAISQSGETADTKVAIEAAKAKGANIFGICNVVGSSIARISHEGIYTHAGIEIGVASTKAFTAQVSVLMLLGIKLAWKRKEISNFQKLELIETLITIPNQVKEILEYSNQIKNIAKELKNSTSMLVLGRGIQYPIALEGALKIKEISYIHAEAYPCGEMKHGPIALIDDSTPTIIICLKDENYTKNISSIQEISARKGPIVGIISKGDEKIKKELDYWIEIPEVNEFISPLLSCIPLQLLAYHIGNLKGLNVDKPRNLAKSVTVE